MVKSDSTNDPEEFPDERNVNTVTHHFSIKKKVNCSSRISQIVTTICASLSCLPFGLMVGWPSPIYPILLDKNSPIPINIDQTAIIAAMLMFGNAAGTFFGHKTIYKTKFGILAGLGIMLVGWALMWQSRNILWLFGSRFLVGLGNAYTAGQLKAYISNVCDEDLKLIQTKCLSLYVYLGVIIVFSLAPFVDFRITSIVCLLISSVIFVVVIFLPASGVGMIKIEKVNEAIADRSKSNEIKGHRSVLKIFTKKEMRYNLVYFLILVICQQLSGAPATIIYIHLILIQSHSPYPEYLSIAYVSIFFICNVIGIFVTPKFNKRIVLLCSTFSVILAVITQILLLQFDVNNNYWNCSFFISMCLYIIAHTVGLGSIPSTLINDLFTIPYRASVTNYFVAFHSLLGVVITKIFQLLMSEFCLVAGFYFFLCNSTFAMIFIYFATPKCVI